MSILKIIFLIIFSFSLSLEINLQFPFYIIKNENPQTPNTFKSFSEIAELPVVKNSNEKMCIEMCFGQPKNCYLLTIHAQSFYIWVQDVKNPDETIENKYDPNLINSAKVNRTVLKLDYGEEKIIKGYTISDKIYIGENFLMRGSFLSAIDSGKFHTNEGMIGLGFRGSKNDEKMSFIYQLYNNGLIFHKIFTQKFTDSEQGTIDFGQMPKVVMEDYAHYGRCNALNKFVNGRQFKNRKWECQVKGIYFGKELDDKLVRKFDNMRASFFSFRKRALLPIEVFEYFVENYFNTYLGNKCQRLLIKEKYDTIKCNEHITDLPNINFIYGDWVMSLACEKLFMYKEETKSYEFLFYHKKNFEHISLGRPVVRLFHMVYDYQNQEIGFYSAENVVYINKYTDPMPPKIYEKLPDANEPINDNDEEYEDENEDNKPKKTKKRAQDIMDEIQDESGVPKKNVNEEIAGAFIMQVCLYIFLIFVIVGFLGFIVFLYIRYKRNAKFLKSEYLIKKATELSTQI